MSQAAGVYAAGAPSEERESVASPAGSRAGLGPWLAACALVLAAALMFQGTRGLWEPDEGFYSNAALGMARGGDLLVPRLNDQVFLDKPPLHYWAMAAGVKLLGENEWGLRLAHALFFAATAALTGALAGRFWEPRYRAAGTLAYGLMLAPFVGSNVLTPDTPLTFFVTGMFYAYGRSMLATRGRSAATWELLAGAAIGLAALAKGPAALVFAVVPALHALLSRGLARGARTVLRLLPAAAGIAALWYAPIVLGVPGAAAYLWDNQVWGRLASGHYHRNAGWLGPLRVYLPTLLAGTLPWSLLLLRLVGRRARRAAQLLPKGSPRLLLVLWLAVPLTVLAAAQSRLPLYLLPLFPAIAVVLSGELGRWLRGWSTARISRVGAVAAWVVVLLVLKAAVSFGAFRADHDAKLLARELEAAGVEREATIVVVDSRWNGLTAYGYRNVLWTRYRGAPYPYFAPPEELPVALHAVSTRTPRQLVLVSTEGGDFTCPLPPALADCDRKSAPDFVVLECAGRRVTTVAARLAAAAGEGRDRGGTSVLAPGMEGLTGPSVLLPPAERPALFSETGYRPLVR